MKTVKYHCEACGFARKPTRKEFFWAMFQRLLLTTFVFLGVLFVVYVALSGISPVMQTFSGGLVGFGGLLVRDGFDYRMVASEMVGDCGDDSLCSATRIYDNLSALPYVPDGVNKFGLYSPAEVLSIGGDCKHTSLLYTNLVRSVGVDSVVVCSVKYRHCVSKLTTQNGVFAVDLTAPAVYRADSVDFWGYVDEQYVVYS